MVGNKLLMISIATSIALADTVVIDKIVIDEKQDKSVKESLTADEIKFTKQSDLGEMLSEMLPEVSHVRASSVGNDIILRGFRKDNINVTIDDTKVCGACPNRMDPPAMHVSSAQIAKVQVKEGPFDVSNFGSLGGTVNIVTKDPQQGVSGELFSTFGSFGYRKYGASVSGGNDKVQATAGYSFETSDQYKDGNGRTLAEQTDALATTAGQKYSSTYKKAKAYERQNFWTKLVFTPDDTQKLSLSYFGDRADNVLYPRYPMDANVDDTDMFNIKYQKFGIGAWSDELKLEAYKSKVTHIMSNEFRAGATTLATTTYVPVDATISGARIENKAITVDTRITYGVDTSLRNWNGSKHSGSYSTNTIMLPDVDTKNIAGYVKAVKSLNAFEVSGGMRYDATTINANQSLTDGVGTANNSYIAGLQDKNYRNLSGNIITKYTLSSSTNFFAGLGQSVRVPDARELYLVAMNTTSTANANSATNGGNDDLKPTLNRELDVGAEQSFTNAKVRGTFFYSDLKDYIYAFKTGASTSTFANIDAVIYGFDLKADYVIGDAWSIQSGIAYQKGLKKDPNQLDVLTAATQTSKNLAEIPPMKGRLAGVYDDGTRYGMLEMIGASSQVYDKDNGEKALSGYAVWNLKGGTSLGKGFSLNGGVTNLFNKTYAVGNSYIGNSYIATATTTPLVINEAGRSVYMNVSYKF